MRGFGPLLAGLTLLSIVGAAPVASAFATSEYALADVEVEIPEGAVIDWHTPGTPEHARQEAFILATFRGAGENAAGGVLTGARPAVLKVDILRFDILSRFEMFFCCALNEVAARFELVDAETGATLLPPREMTFDHISRSGVVALIADEQNEDQLQRVGAMVNDSVVDWILGGS